jgi:hypothetical protein
MWLRPALIPSTTPLADVEADGAVAGARELHRQRQTHVPKADDADSTRERSCSWAMFISRSTTCGR